MYPPYTRTQEALGARCLRVRLATDWTLMSYRETEHLRVLIANERKDRLALVAPIVAHSGTR